MRESKAFIAGISGKTLTKDEIGFIRDEKPWGFILFARNIGESKQISDLTAHLRDLTGYPKTLIFIDQEGGRVQRLRPPLVSNYPSAFTLGELYQTDKQMGLRATWLLSRLHAFDLLKLGINANCLPVLDVPVKGAHDVIGMRAYAHNPVIVAAMGRAAVDGLLAGGVVPVMKHIPGHGRAVNDTHKELAKVDTQLQDLERTDFVPFRALADLPMAMSAHVVFTVIDPICPATLSHKVINKIIRHFIGFDGLLMSDDIAMKALSGDIGDLTDAAFAAGCDIVLHCNGLMNELVAVARRAPILSEKAYNRAWSAEMFAGDPDHFLETEIREEFHSLFMENRQDGRQ